MELVVGDKNCSFNDVILAMKGCETFSEIRGNRRLIGAYLALSKGTLDTIKATVQDEDPFLIMQEMLPKWRLTSGNQAKLQKLIPALTDADMKDIADTLTARFTNSLPPTYPSNPHYPGYAAQVRPPSATFGGVSIEQKKNHINQNMEKLIGITYFRSSFSARMIGQGVLDSSEVEELEAEKVRQDQNTKFYRFVRDKFDGQPDVYEKMIKALDDLRQSGASAILKQVYSG